MFGYVLRRLGQAIIVILGVTLVIFILEKQAPGNIARQVLGPRATQAQLHSFNVEYDLNLPVWDQYFHFLWHLVQGNLGFSWKQNRTVDSLISSELPRDLVLVGSSTILAVLIAVPLGIAQAVRRNTLFDYGGTGVSFLLYSMPPYVPALLGIELFALKIHAFPTQAPSGSWTTYPEHLNALVLPVATLTLVTYALFIRYIRSSTIDTLTQDFIRTARAKGLSERKVIFRHVVRNSLGPTATMVGVSIPQILTAGLITEQVFNFPGVGYQYFISATQNDFPVLIGITVLVALATVLGNLVADLSLGALDPRVRL